MTGNIFKKIPIALAAVAFASASAAMDMDSRVTQLEQQMSQVRTENAMGTYGAKTAPANPDITAGADWFLELALLYEQARIGGTEYAYSENGPDTTLPRSGGIRDARPGWQFGVTVGAGVITTHDDWQIYAEYTHLGSSGSSSMNGGLNGIVVPLRSTFDVIGAGLTFNQATQAKATVDFSLNTVTLQAARDFYLSRTLSIKPYTGLTSTWMDLKEKVAYSGGPDIGVNSVYVNDKSNFWGLGPVGGLNGKIHLGAGFSVYSDISGTLYFGNFDVTHRESYSISGDNTIRVSGDYHRMIPAMAMGLGLVYDKYLDDNRHHISVSLGYDTSYYWRANQMLRLADDVTLSYERYSEDVYIEGVKLDLRWDF